jgi:hypothetical protein
VLNIIFPDRDSKESRYYGRKSGRSLSFVASSPLDKDATFFNKRIPTIEILEKDKNHSASARMQKKRFLFEVS